MVIVSCIAALTIELATVGAARQFEWGACNVRSV